MESLNDPLIFMARIKIYLGDFPIWKEKTTNLDEENTQRILKNQKRPKSKINNQSQKLKGKTTSKNNLLLYYDEFKGI